MPSGRVQSLLVVFYRVQASSFPQPPSSPPLSSTTHRRHQPVSREVTPVDGIVKPSTPTGSIVQPVDNPWEGLWMTFRLIFASISATNSSMDENKSDWTASHLWKHDRCDPSRLRRTTVEPLRV